VQRHIFPLIYTIPPNKQPSDIKEDAYKAAMKKVCCTSGMITIFVQRAS